MATDFQMPRITAAQGTCPKMLLHVTSTGGMPNASNSVCVNRTAGWIAVNECIKRTRIHGMQTGFTLVSVASALYLNYFAPCSECTHHHRSTEINLFIFV